MKYKNYSYTTKTFYGIKFRPGETHDVPGYINDPKFVRVKGVENSDNSIQSVEPVLQATPTATIAEPVTAKRTMKTKTTTKEELTNGTDCDQ